MGTLAQLRPRTEGMSIESNGLLAGANDVREDYVELYPSEFTTDLLSHSRLDRHQMIEERTEPWDLSEELVSPMLMDLDEALRYYMPDKGDPRFEYGLQDEIGALSTIPFSWRRVISRYQDRIDYEPDNY